MGLWVTFVGLDARALVGEEHQQGRGLSCLQELDYQGGPPPSVKLTLSVLASYFPERFLNLRADKLTSIRSK
jgi:hypothetical protein